jgi:hypothetical protein
MARRGLVDLERGLQFLPASATSSVRMGNPTHTSFTPLLTGRQAPSEGIVNYPNRAPSSLL